MNARSGRQGAALIIVVAILTFLLLIALAFFNEARLEEHISRNTMAGVKANQLAEAGTAIAMDALNKDFVIHAMYTSTDHAWRTRFNGAWAVGKPWAWAVLKDKNGAFRPVSPIEGGIPEVDADVPEVNGARGIDEVQMAGDFLDVPRIQDGAYPGENPAGDFVTTSDLSDQWPAILYADPGLPLLHPNPDPAVDRDGNAYISPDDLLLPEWEVHTFADVDNDGDGYRDSIWIPIGADEFLVDDGIDNDLDGMTDEKGPDGIDNDGDTLIDEPDELNEPCIFVYWGGDDGLDNNGNGLVDEPGEQRIFLTAPIRNAKNSNTYIDPFPVDRRIEGDTIENPFAPQVRTENGVRIETYLVEPDPFGATTSVDVIDNDWSQVVNDHVEYFPIRDELLQDPAELVARDLVPGRDGDPPGIARTTHHIADIYLGSLADPTENFTIWSTGEPVCELVGRVAILITDEASKVNVNNAGGHVLNENWDGAAWDGMLRSALGGGTGPWEYETRVLPGIGVGLSGNLWALLNGTPEKTLLTVVPTDPLEWDKVFPGYGRVDDNGSILRMASDGIDNDADGLIDEGFKLPPLPALPDPSDPDAVAEYDRLFLEYQGYAAQLGNFEGVDEPQERRLYRPYRDLIAEANLVDDDGDGAIDEIGEMGDRVLPDRDSLQNEVAQIGSERNKALAPFVTAHSEDRPKAFARKEDGTLIEPSGMKLDYNLVPASDIFSMLKRDFPRQYQPVKFTRLLIPGELEMSPEQDFARGLRQQDVTVAGSFFDYVLQNALGFAELEVTMLADDELRAAKLAADVKDYGDADHTRTEMVTFADDDWWTKLQVDAGVAPGNVEKKQIEYRTSGAETIRINELMVRPVRRVEAEMLTLGNPNRNELPDPAYLPMFDPNPFGSFQFDLLGGGTFALGFDMVQDFVDIDSWRDEFGESTWSRAAVPGHPGMGVGEVLETDAVGNSVVPLPPDPTFPDGSGWMPNAIQFRFGPSTGLPPGRYYLVMNMNAHEFFSNSGELEFALKYGYADDQANVPYASVLADMDEEWLGLGGVVLEPWGWNVWQSNVRVGQENIEGQAPGPRTGYVFLPSSELPAPQPPEFVPASLGGLEPDGMSPLVGYFQDHAYTVIIPGYAGPGESQVYLYVAIRKRVDWSNYPVIDPTCDATGNNCARLAIDFFDFSQEPDHEWVEIVNIAEWDPSLPAYTQATDLSDWQLDAGGRLFTIPGGTYIAPGGSLLLSFSKHDYGVEKFDVNWDDPDAANYWFGAYAAMGAFEKNGIGLASLSSFEGVATVPTTLNPLTGLLGDPRDFVSIPPMNLVDGAQLNVFDPVGLTDIVDLNGNGIPDGDETACPDDWVTSTIDESGFVGIADAPDKAWDRIVQLEGALDNVVLLEDVAKIVLGGGVLPNYPEEDGVDNDGDNDALIADGVDNDADGFFDDNDNLYTDLNGNGRYDSGVDRVTDDEGARGVEGVDEGRWYHAAIAGYDLAGAFQLGLGAPDIITTDFLTASGLETTSMLPYAGDELNGDSSPSWRAFVERRWYPGDCVIVTLYEGSAGMGRVVDRVTYTEDDVTNRAIDDGVLIPPVDPTDPSGPRAREPWNTRYLSIWPENTMGIDFYRTLERKHPLYAGDRFGTSNRWQATDGNYDDWDNSTSLWYADDSVDPALYGSTLVGSPLTFNFFHRRAAGLLPDEFANISGGSDRALEFNRGAPDWMGWIRNKPYESPGDVLRMPHLVLRADMMPPMPPEDNTSPFFGGLLATSGHTDNEWVMEILVGDRSSGELFGANGDQVLALDASMDRTALGIGSSGGLNSGDVLMLSVAQADKPLIFDPQDPTNPTDDVWLEDSWPEASRTGPLSNFFPMPDPDWTPNPPPSDAPAGLMDIPEPYTPVYLFSFAAMGGAEVQIERTALFDGATLFDVDWCPGFSWGLDAAEMQLRWTEPLRRCFYISRNYDTFNPAMPRVGAVPGEDIAISPAAFFAWRADAGLENGRYDVGIVFANPLESLREMMRDMGVVPPLGFSGSILTPFGQALLDPPPDLELGASMAAYVTLYTDPKYYREPAAINQDHANPLLTEPSILPERLVAAVPGGVAYCGTVTIENNFLGMRLRNWTPNNQLAAFAYIVLTPKDRVAGKININTVTTHVVETATPPSVFNPLAGLPGTVLDYDYGPLGSAFRPISPFEAISTPNLMEAVDVLNGVAINPGGPSAIQYHMRLYDRWYSIMAKRPEWPDGRYYRCAADLLGYASYFDGLGGTLFAANDGLLAWKTDRVLLDASDPFNLLLVPQWNVPAAQQNPLIPGYKDVQIGQLALDGLIDSAGADLLRFDEGVARYSRMVNLITTRSDVFEIVVTAQSGSGTDTNGDGRINYRSPDEFTASAEKKIRTVYSR